MNDPMQPKRENVVAFYRDKQTTGGCTLPARKFRGLNETLQGVLYIPGEFFVNEKTGGLQLGYDGPDVLKSKGPLILQLLADAGVFGNVYYGAGDGSGPIYLLGAAQGSIETQVVPSESG